MKKIILSLLLISLNANANMADMFGASSSSMALGGQADLRSHESSNNYYHPAFLGFSRDIRLSLSGAFIKTDLKSFGEIVVENDINSQSGERKEVVTPKVKDMPVAYLHVGLPINGNLAGSLGLSVMAPIGTLAQTDSGDPFLPEYVMYKSRYKRTLIHLNYAKPFNDNFAVSLGVHMGFQAGATVDADLSLNGTSYGSNSRSSTKIEPSLGVIASFAYLGEKSALGFTFQQEMKSNLEAKSAGVINDPVSLPFEIQIESMIYYDPHMLRLNYQYDFGPVEIFVGGDYQIWDHYKTPTIRISRHTGGVVLPSDNYESVETKNIFIPKAAFTFNVTDKFSVLTGFSHRPTPLKGDFSGSGNSIDTDAYLYGLGLEYRTTVFGKKSKFNLSGQYVDLKRKQVVKSDGQENETPGNKLGSPGYPIDGNIQVLSVGLSVEI